MECKVQKTIAMDPIAAAFDELYEKSPIPMLIPHLFTISDSHQRFAPPPSLSGSFIRPPPKPRKRSILQSLKNLSDDCSLLEQDSSINQTVDTSQVESPSIPNQFHQSDEEVTVDNNNTEDISDKIAFDSIKTSSLQECTETIAKANHSDESCKVAESKSNSSQNAASSKIYILLDWNIKPAPQCRGILVEGKLHGSDDSDVLWHSSPITKRLQVRNVLSSTGSIYKLKGRINQLASLESGFIMPVVLKFKNGFPTDWLEVMTEYYDYIESSESPDYPANNIESTPANMRISNKCNNLVSTPNGMVDVEALPRTKSGRRVKPPLAWWMGQRTLVDPVTDKLSIQCTTEKAESVLNHLALDASKSTKTSKHNTLRAIKASNCKSESAQLKKDVMDIIQSSKAERLSKKVKPRATCYTSENDTEKLKQPVVVITDIKHKENEMNCDNNDPFDVNSDSDDQNTRHRHSINTRRRKSGDNDRSSKNSDERLQHVETSPCKRNLRERKMINYRERKNSYVKSSSVRNSGYDNKSRSQKQSSYDDRSSSRKKSSYDDRSSSRKKSSYDDRSSSKNKISYDGRSSRRKKTSYNDQSSTKSRYDDKSSSKFCYDDKSSSRKKTHDVNKSHRKKKSRNARDISKSIQMKTVEDLNEKSTAAMDETCQATKVDKLSKQKLEKVLRETNQNDPDFWNAISKVVNTHSAAECQEFCLQEIPPVKPKKRRGKSSVSTHKDIIAGIGTLKRKQQLRDFLDKQNEDYTGDLFDSTPMRTKALRKVGRLDCDDVIDVFDSVTPGTRHQTPGIRYSMPLRSTGKTPFTNQISPWMEPVHRTHADQYINKVQKNKRKRIHKTHQTPSRPSDASNCQPVKALFMGSEDTHNLFTGVECMEEVQEEEDEDYYWTDEMEN